MEPGHWILITLIIAWAAVMLGATWHASQRALHRHRERLSMIEKGLPLPPEQSALSPWGIIRGETAADNSIQRERRLLSFIRFVGIMTLAAGAGVYLLLTIMSQWEAGVAIGGLMVIVGSALILTVVRALSVRRRADDDGGRV
jgi:hypothetical protein